METLLIRIKDKSKADAVSLFLKEMGIVEEIQTVSHWEENGETDDDYTQMKKSVLSKKNPSILKHLIDES